MEGEPDKEKELPSVEEVREKRDGMNYRRRFRKMLWSTLAALIVVAAIAALISTLFLSVIQVSGDSMEPTLSNGDVILLVKTKKYSHKDLCCISWQNKLLIKRVIALPGETEAFHLFEMDGLVFEG